MKFQELKKSLVELKQFYLIRGSDAFLRQKAVDMLISAGLTMPDLNLSIFDNENYDMSSIVTALNSIPMMDSHRVILLNDIPIKKSDELKAMIDFVTHPIESTIIIVVDSLNNSAIKKLEPYFTLVDCSPLDTSMIGKLVATQLRQYGCTINSDALQLLVDYCNADYTRINNETIKLGNMLDKGAVVTAEIVAEYVHREVDYDVFELSKAVSSKNGKLAMDIINKLLEQKESPQMLLMMLLANFRRVFYAITSKETNAQIATKLGVKEYAIKVAREVGSQFTPAQLKRLLDMGAELDYQIKAGLVDDHNALLYFVANSIKDYKAK